ncbi:ubiquitin-conjugating enzyme E2 J1 [Arthroderma uncinatum]|uniref:ubiquitin-conjugating enzyme E2 J1 n=1 Tax=Arthroderma uncinatum TaxID=74035 RepID=UPI00144ACB1E|nr:ubiquitin-conjugating enzyme E2 J1 [Arthroderma uncinatum]KAF3483291.1 ubiquitin-conjugating enzyme E2 J1 [Arthroderma uncinatum]
MSNTTTLRRLMKEAQELSPSSSSPSPYFHAHPVSDSNLFDWHFTLAGPPAPSPYANGIYHGRIVLPPQYPLRPPSFRFLTPSGRFEVNREICLSISGHHEQTWQPAWGIRTALTGIRSFMDGEAKGQVGGLDATNEARKDWAKRSREWVCPGCAEGKTNEEVLTQWQNICRERGVNVDNEGRPGGRRLGGDAVPEGLNFGYRDEMEKGASKSSPGPAQSPATTLLPAADGKNKDADQQVPPPSDNGAQTSTTATATINPGQTGILSNRSRVTSNTRSQTLSTPQREQTQTLARGAPETAEGPWLDRAIIGVICALAFVILRKVLFAPAEL